MRPKQGRNRLRKLTADGKQRETHVPGQNSNWFCEGEVDVFFEANPEEAKIILQSMVNVMLVLKIRLLTTVGR